MKFLKKLVGDNIYLSPRNVNEEVVEKFTEWLNDFDTTDYLGKSSTVVTIADEVKHFENPKDDERVFFIVRLEDDELIGTVRTTQY